MLLCRLVLAVPAQAAVSPAERPAIDDAEAYLNAITTLQARFLQVAADGSTAEGTVYLKRPGAMRLEYDPPSPVLIIGTSSWLVYYDRQLDQTSYLDIDKTPAAVLVSPKVQLDAGDLAVTRVARPPGMLDITVIHRGDPRGGSITLVFTRQPFALRQWQVVDAQGQVTTVSLFDPHDGIAVSDDLFDLRKLPGANHSDADR
jgi:outer membrane lipoprotein-sorting protein